VGMYLPHLLDATLHAELSMGPFSVTLPNQTRQLGDPTQPDTTNSKTVGS